MDTLHVLLIENETLIGMELEQAFRDQGWTVTWPGKSARLKPSERMAFDVAVVCLSVSGTDEIMDDLIAKGTPVIVHSGMDTTNTRVVVLPKPSDPGDIVAAIRGCTGAEGSPSR